MHLNCYFGLYEATDVLNPMLLQVIMSLLEAEMGNCVGLTWTFHLDRTESSGMC